MSNLPITRVVLYKHGVGYFEREANIEGDATLSLTFKQREVSDVLKSLTVLDLDEGRISSVSYDSTKPLDQLLAEVAISIPDERSLIHLLPQLKGVRVALHSGVSDPVEGVILGMDTTQRQTGDGLVTVDLIAVLTDQGDIRSLDLHNLASVEIRDPALRRDLDYYLKTQLSAKKKESRTFTFFAQGDGQRKVRVSYTLESPVWKATYRILLPSEKQADEKPRIQGWAVVDNTQDEDWIDVRLALIAGLPVSFTHDLYTPRFTRRPEVTVRETTGVLPPEMEMGLSLEQEHLDDLGLQDASPELMRKRAGKAKQDRRLSEIAKGGTAMLAAPAPAVSAPSSMPAQVRERKIGDLFEYEIEHPVTIQRNQSALVPIVLRDFEGRAVLLYNKLNRAANPMRCVEFKNTTGLTLEGGPITVIEAGAYVGEAMLETIKPDEQRLVPFAVELGVFVLDNVESHQDHVHHVVVRNGYLVASAWHVLKTTYHFENKADVDYVVWLEHQRDGAEWTLVDTAAPAEITENFWRFRLKIAAKKTTAFSAIKKISIQNSFHLGSISDQQLGVWIQQKYLDARSAKAIQQILGIRQSITQKEGAIQILEKERTDIHHEQKRIRENMQALGERSSEKELRERFVRTLHSQEDRLDAITRELKSLTAERDRFRDSLNASLASLEYEANVS